MSIFLSIIIKNLTLEMFQNGFQMKGNSFKQRKIVKNFSLRELSEQNNIKTLHFQSERQKFDIREKQIKNTASGRTISRESSTGSLEHGRESTLALQCLLERF